MAGKTNPYDYEPEYSDDEDIGNVNVDKYEIRNAADVTSDCSEGNSPLSYLDLQCWQATNILVSMWEISKHGQVPPSLYVYTTPLFDTTVWLQPNLARIFGLIQESFEPKHIWHTPGGILGGQKFKKSGNVMNCLENQ